MKIKTKDPSKQRKLLYNAPHHIRAKIMLAHLSQNLRESYGVRSLPIRSGDTVRILRGDYKDYEGRVTRVDRRKYRIYVDGVAREKADGTTTPVPIHYSKVEITRLNLDDDWRKRILERKGSPEKEEKPSEETDEKEREEGSEKPSGNDKKLRSRG
ncbi:50S ribosomal protein L24 [Candidatus Bathyarchaeota archaeon]|nr:MAG: 50S ribosomal protein L24 [Candidatus Bathyarchaeota archaeon]